MTEQPIYAGTQKDWRTWLEKNHLTEKKVGVIVHKKHTGKPTLSHREYMNEAICFGWIDTTIKRLDEDTFLRYFARRNDKSRWSDNTLSYAKQLLAEGRMAPEGIRRYEEGRSRKTHDHGIPKNPDMPKELKAALKKNKQAQKAFILLTPSMKRMHYRMILHAKLSETREKRVQTVIAAATKQQKRRE